MGTDNITSRQSLARQLADVWDLTRQLAQENGAGTRPDFAVQAKRREVLRAIAAAGLPAPFFVDDAQ